MTSVARVMTVSTMVAFLGAPAFAQDVTYEVHRGQDFSRVRTFSIRDPEVKASQRSPWDSSIVREETNAAVAAQLQAHGLRRDDVHPDVHVMTYRLFDTQFWGYGSPGWNDGFWGHRGYWSYYTDPIVASTLIVDIRSPDTGDLLWRGVAERNMHVTSSWERQLKRINKEVRKIFENYPLGTVATGGHEIPQPTGR